MRLKGIKDPVILGLVSGLIGNTVKMAGNYFNRSVLRKSDATYAEISSGLFMSKKERDKPIGRVVGFLADNALGAAMGIPMVYMLRYTGKDKAAIKGLGFGHLSWVLMYGAVTRGLGPSKGVFPLNADTNFSAFINHSLYGLTTSLAVAKLGDPSLFSEPVSSQTETELTMTDEDQKKTNIRIKFPVKERYKRKTGEEIQYYQ